MPHSKVVEIAANDGYLLRWFLPKGMPVLGVEPAANVAEAARKLGIPMEVLFFGRETATQLKAQGHAADLMAANNVVAHVPDINDFVAGFTELLKPTGVATFEFHHVLNLLTLNQFDNDLPRALLLSLADDLQQDPRASRPAGVRRRGDHRPRRFAARVLPAAGDRRAAAVDARVAAMLGARDARPASIRWRPISRWNERIKATKRSLLAFVLEAAEKPRSRSPPTALRPRATTLLNYAGVRADYIEYTVDRNPHKQNHFLPGTQIPIYGPERHRADAARLPA